MPVVVDRSVYGDPSVVYTNRPFQPSSEYAVTEALALAMIPADEVRGIRPRLPRVPNPETPHPPVFSIYEAMGTAPPDRSWAKTGPRGTPVGRGDQMGEMWESSARNVTIP